MKERWCIIDLDCDFLQEAAVNGRLVTRRNLTLEFVSFEDGKEAVAKAANYLFVKHYANGTKEKSDFTEPQMAEALGAIGILSCLFLSSQIFRTFSRYFSSIVCASLYYSC